MWYDLNETPYPETVRITGRPIGGKLPPIKKGYPYRLEIMELKAYEAAGLIYAPPIKDQFANNQKYDIIPLTSKDDYSKLNTEENMRETLTREELEQIYTQNTNKAAADRLGVSIVTLLKMIDKAGIPFKGKGYAQKYLVV